MKIPMAERRILTKHWAKEYQKANRKEKSRILDRFVRETLHNRVYAARILRNEGKQVRVNVRTVVRGDSGKRLERRHPKTYGDDVQEALVTLWEYSGYLCGKRLVPALPDLVEALERFGEIALDPEVRRKVLTLSPATADRLLAPERRQWNGRGRGGTKPGTLLKSQIPIRTFADWDESQPGFVEIDLVGHDGGISEGEYLQTLDVTDVHTGWSEQRAVLTKAQCWVLDALKDIKKRLPFALRGIDSDNGAEFINGHLKAYCEANRITFTRARAYRKNDNCYVEQKNYSIVRRAVGYGRYVGEEAQAALNALYDVVRLQTNWFQPTMKLIEKHRHGSRVAKRYEKPKSPFRRVLESPDVSAPAKAALVAVFETLNPAEIRSQIAALQKRVDQLTHRRDYARTHQKPDAPPPSCAPGSPPSPARRRGAGTHRQRKRSSAERR